MRLWTRNPFAGVTVVGLIFALVGALAPLVDATALTPSGLVILQVVGVLVTAFGPSLLSSTKEPPAYGP